LPQSLANRLLIIVAIAFGVAAVFLPLEVVEVIGGPFVVAGAYFGGRPGGVLTALWAVFCASVAFFVIGDAAVDDFVVTVVGYLILGIALGYGVERFRRQREELESAIQAMRAYQGQLSVSQKRYRLLFESTHDAVYLHGLDGHGEPTRFVGVNDAACERLGYTREEILGLLPRALDAAPRPGQLREIMAQLMKHDQVMYETALRARTGEIIQLEVSSSLTEVDGELMVISIARDISERKEHEYELLQLSLRDQLTGLLNRRGFLVMISEHRKRARRVGQPLVVLYADLDGLKLINDGFGHARGDQALEAVAHALTRTFRESDLLARLGGDEFCVVAQAEEPADPEALISRLDDALAAAGARLGLALSMSYGTVVTDWRGLEDPDELLTRADMLMYRNKRSRQNSRAATPVVEPPDQG
jgi:diguanylate cyclase (GGDEF)-like protein/PAS domain S-box-containing protein